MKTPLAVLALLAGGWLCACSTGEEGDVLASIHYGQQALERHVQRRIHLLSAGVALRGELAVERVWRNSMGHTFIGRRPEQEAGILSLQTLRLGVKVEQRPPGIRRSGPGLYRLEQGYGIVDVFSPEDRYLGSVVVGAQVGERWILRHLGVARPHSASLDRLFLDPESIVRWRELLSVVRSSGGYGPLYMRQRGTTAQDSLVVRAERYEVEELEDFVLVGKTRAGERYRHIFTAGGKYLISTIEYGEAPLGGRALLDSLGVFGAPGAEPEAP